MVLRSPLDDSFAVDGPLHVFLVLQRALLRESAKNHLQKKSDYHSFDLELEKNAVSVCVFDQCPPLAILLLHKESPLPPSSTHTHTHTPPVSQHLFYVCIDNSVSRYRTTGAVPLSVDLGSRKPAFGKAPSLRSPSASGFSPRPRMSDLPPDRSHTSASTSRPRTSPAQALRQRLQRTAFLPPPSPSTQTPRSARSSQPQTRRQQHLRRHSSVGVGPVAEPVPSLFSKLEQVR